MRITPSLRGVKELLTEVGDFIQPMVALVMRQYWKGKCRSETHSPRNLPGN